MIDFHQLAWVRLIFGFALRNIYRKIHESIAGYAKIKNQTLKVAK